MCVEMLNMVVVQVIACVLICYKLHDVWM